MDKNYKCVVGDFHYYPQNPQANQAFYADFLRSDGEGQMSVLIDLFDQDKHICGRFLEEMTTYDISLNYGYLGSILQACTDNPKYRELAVLMIRGLQDSSGEAIFACFIQNRQDFVLDQNLFSCIEEDQLIDNARNLLSKGDASYLKKYLKLYSPRQLGSYLEQSLSSAMVGKEFVLDMLDGELSTFLPVPNEKDVIAALKTMFHRPNTLDPLEMLPWLEKRMGAPIPWERCYKTLANACVASYDVASLAFVLDKAGDHFKQSPIHRQSLLVGSLLQKRRISGSAPLASKIQEVIDLCLLYVTPKEAVMGCFDRPDMMETLLLHQGFEQHHKEVLGFLGEAYFVRHQDKMPHSKKLFDREMMKEALGTTTSLPRPKKIM